jgi:hypothetical protein
VSDKIPERFKVWTVEITSKTTFTVAAEKAEDVRVAVDDYGPQELLDNEPTPPTVEILEGTGLTPEQANNGVSYEGELLEIGEWLETLVDEEENEVIPMDVETLPLVPKERP